MGDDIVTGRSTGSETNVDDRPEPLITHLKILTIELDNYNTKPVQLSYLL